MGLLGVLFTPVAVLLAISFFLGLGVIKKRLSPHRLPLPPGPRGLPVLGSALEINKDEPWLTYQDWEEEHGEIVSCKLLGQVYVIINSERVAKALLDQRSSIYSGRPVIETSRLFGIEFNTAHLSPSDPKWKSHRKMFHQTINNSMIPRYHDALNKRVRTLLSGLLDSPGDYEAHMNAFAASIIMSIIYGYEVASKDDQFVTPLQEVIRIVVHTTPERAALLSFFPQLANLPPWFPGATFQRMAKRCKELSPVVRNGPFQFVRECLEKGIENDSMVAQLLKDDSVPDQARAAHEQDTKDCGTSSFIAGSDSTRSVLLSLILALLLNPHIQDHVHALIDEAVGRDRLPTFDDAPSLQYIDALVRETMRWAALVPMGVPHMLTKDDVFEQYFIPKGSVIIANHWGMGRNPDKFPDPAEFRPERHLDADGNLLADDLSGLNFGYGRRACPGRYLANASTWLGAANMLAMFKFSRAIGPAGYEIDVSARFTIGVARKPLSFPCQITPRFEGAEQLLGA